MKVTDEEWDLLKLMDEYACDLRTMHSYDRDDDGVAEVRRSLRRACKMWLAQAAGKYGNEPDDR